MQTRPNHQVGSTINIRPYKVDILDVLQHLKAPHVLVWAVILLVVYHLKIDIPKICPRYYKRKKPNQNYVQHVAIGNYLCLSFCLSIRFQQGI